MDITEFAKNTGTFLKAAELSGETKAVIVGEAEVKPNEKFGGERLHIPVSLNEDNFTFDASKTNSRTISEALGMDTKAWIGKILVLETYKTKTSDGKMVDAINVKEVLTEEVAEAFDNPKTTKVVQG